MIIQDKHKDKKSKVIPWIIRAVLLVVIILLTVASVRGFTASKVLNLPKSDLVEKIDGSDYSAIWEGKPVKKEGGYLRFKFVMLSGWKDMGWIEIDKPILRVNAAGKSGQGKLVIKNKLGTVVHCGRIRGRAQKIDLERHGKYHFYVVGAWFSANTELVPEDRPIK